MEKLSHQHHNNTASHQTTAAKSASKLKRTRKSVPRDSLPRRSSVYRGVTRHRWTGRFEAHLWDKNCWNETQNKKGRQGAYEDEEAAAHAYDLAALKYWGSQDTILNFPLATYQNQLKEMEGQSKEEYIGSLRRHHHNGRWEARIGRVSGNKYLYLGTYATQEEAATAYDMAAIEYRGLNAVTNFDLSRYIKWLRPTPQSNPNDNSENLNGHTNSTTLITPPQLDDGGGNSTSSTLEFLFKSSKFKEMIKRTSVDCPSTPLESDPPRRSFPDDIQTYFGCQDSNNYTEGDDIVFGDINTFATPMFHCELDC
ncbi:hypothetical protein V6N13_048273 [Hibiscus sabdariffa]